MKLLQVVKAVNSMNLKLILLASVTKAVKWEYIGMELKLNNYENNIIIYDYLIGTVFYDA